MSQRLIDDALWDRVEPLLPKRRRRRGKAMGRPRVPDRAALTGMLFVLRAGLPWQMLPKEMGVDRAARAGGGWSVGSGPGCGGGSMKPSSPNFGSAANWTWRAPSSTAPRYGRCVGEKTGPNPTDRRKKGSKHHLLTDARGIPIVARLTAANRNDITELLPLVDAFPSLRGRPGRPCRKPALIQGDRGYDSQPHRDELHRRRIKTQLADATRQRHDAVVRQHVAIERIDCRIVDVRREHAFAQIVEHDDLYGATQPAKGALVQLRPDLRTRFHTSNRTALREQPNVKTKRRVRRYFPVAASRTIGPSP